MKQFKALLFIIIFFLHLADGIGQQNYSRFLPNAQSIGMGGSGVALAIDPAAAYWNPASIAFLISNQVLINVNNESYLNYMGLTKFFPPSLALAINYSRFSVAADDYYDMATIAMGYRLTSFASAGTNVNFSKTMNNEIFSSLGLGLFIKSVPNYRSSYQSSTPFWQWFRSKTMKDKFSLGLMVHNISLNNHETNHVLRIGVAIKPVSLGPSIHFAYHGTSDDYSLHLGTLTALSRHTDVYFGVKDLDINQFAVGGAIEVGPFQLNLSYAFKYSKIYFSLALRLSEEKDLLFKKYKEIGNQQVKNNDFSAAKRTYLKALAYHPENEELNYFVSILDKGDNETTRKTDSLFVSGENFELKGWYINAFMSYQKILDIEPKNRKAHHLLKRLNSKLFPYLNQVYRQGVIYYNQSDLKRAQIIFDQILLVDKNHEGAQYYLSKIDSTNSNTANNYFYRGLGYFNQNNLSRAQEEFENALKHDPNHEQAKEYQKKTAETIETNRRLINRYWTEAQNYEQQKQYGKATLAYRKILEIDNTHQEARQKLAYLDSYIKSDVEKKYQRARRFYDQTDYSAAIALLNDVLSIDPNHRAAKNYLRRANQNLLTLAEQHYGRAQNYYHQKKWDFVLQECNLTLSMNPTHLAAQELKQTALDNLSLDKLLEKGVRYFEQGDYLNARSIFSQVISKEPFNAAAGHYLARIESDIKTRLEELMRMGMEKFADGAYEEAIKDWKKILNIDPNHKSAKEYIQKANERIAALNTIK